MKRLIIMFFLFQMLFYAAGETNSYHGIAEYYFQFAEISNDLELKTENDEMSDSQKDMFWNCTFKPLNDNKIKYDSIQKFINIFSNQILELFVIKSGDLLIIYEKNTSKPYFVGTSEFQNDGRMLPVAALSSSSFLREGEKKYSIENLKNINSDSPWCEGAEDNGIGEQLIIECPSNKLIFFNGFFSVVKHHLYTENSRLKKIELEIPELEYSTIIELEDNWHPQKVNLSIKTENEKRKSYLMKITILEVYEGSKYKDTCLSGLFFDF